MKHKKILEARNTKTSKLQPKNRQDRACRIELKNSSRKIHPATGVEKNVPQKMHFLGSIKRGAKSGEKPPQIRPSPSQDMSQSSESQYSCIFHEPMNRGKYAYMHEWVKCALGFFFFLVYVDGPAGKPKNATKRFCTFVGSFGISKSMKIIDTVR